MFLEFYGVILVKNYVIRFFGCNIVVFSLHRCEWRTVFAEK